MNTELHECMRKKKIRIICNIFICSGIFVNENKNNRLMDVTEV